MKSTSAIAIALTICLPALTRSAPNLIVNGDFETPAVVNRSAGFDTYSSGESIPGWTVAGGSIDIVADDPGAWVSWTAASGHQSVDLTGEGLGSIYQDMPTIPGNTYALSFALAGNSAQGTPPVVTMDFYWEDEIVDTLSFTVVFNRSNPGWAYHQYTLIAPTEGARLRFESLGSGPTGGPAIDDVVVETVCEAPHVSCPENVTRQCNDPGICGSVVSDIDPIVSGTCQPALTYALSGATTATGKGSATGLTFNLGITTVRYTVTNVEGGQDTCSFTVTVLDCEAVSVDCVPSINVAGKTTPPAGAKPKNIANPDGFYRLLATDNNCDGAPLQIFVKDSAEGPCGGAFAAGPYASGTQVALTQSSGTARVQPMAGVIVAHIHTKGDPVLVVTDSAGNTTCHLCRLLPK